MGKRRYAELDAATKDDLRWIRNANRRNAKRDRDLPLFAHAGIVDQVDPYDSPEGRKSYIEALWEGQRLAKDEYMVRSRKRLDLYIEWLDDLGIDAHKAMAESWLASWRKLDDMTYCADFLNAMIAERTGSTKLEIHDYISRILDQGEL